jgi:hypothetical protein
MDQRDQAMQYRAERDEARYRDLARQMQDQSNAANARYESLAKQVVDQYEAMQDLVMSLATQMKFDRSRRGSETSSKHTNEWVAQQQLIRKVAVVDQPTQNQDQVNPTQDLQSSG